jgi:replication factor C subunit 3/5
MFLVDKYYNKYNNITHHQTIINNLIKTFKVNEDIKSIITKPYNEFKKSVDNIYYNNARYNNFHHLIVYGLSSLNKQYIIDQILEIIYDKPGIQLKDVDYMISGYSNTKTKITIKQSQHHIVIEPNSNGFDKYLIQEIIQEYAKSNILNIIKERHTFKVVVINKIDRLSYYAQASLRRTMEKYSTICKFILISEQLSNIIEPLRSRCSLVRVPLLSKPDILNIILSIIHEEDIKINSKDLHSIIKNSNNKINRAIWLLEMYTYNINYKDNWEDIIDNIINFIIDVNNYTNKNLLSLIKNIRDQFYILFITNISTSKIIKYMMNKLLKLTNDIDLRYNIINLTSIFENRIHQGTRHIIHIEAYVLQLINLFSQL